MPVPTGICKELCGDTGSRHRLSAIAARIASRWLLTWRATRSRHEHMNDNENDTGKAALSRREILGLAAGATMGAAVYAAPGQSAEGRANDIVLMDATVLSKAIHSRKVSCVEVMSAYLEHIERTNPR